MLGVGLAGWFYITVPAVLGGLLSVLPPVGRAHRPVLRTPQARRNQGHGGAWSSGTAHFAPTDTTITISNDGELPHTFTAVDGSFDSGQVQPGETFELTIDQPGVFEVFCTLHGTAQGQGMAGVLLVGEAQPLPVSAQIDVAAIKQAVAEKDGAVIEAIDHQSQLLDNLVSDQALLIQSLEEKPSASETDPTPSPAIPPVPLESVTDTTWVALAAGLALGLSVAALMVAHRSKRRQDQASRLDGLEPSTGP